MSRFIFSNQDLVDRMGSKERKILSTGWSSVWCYNKININNNNHFEDSKDWIVGVGTYIYKHQKDSEALRLILEDFTPKTISCLKKTIRGVYSILLFKDGIIYCFNDYYGLFDTIYGNTGKGFFVGNNLADIKPLLSSSEINEFPFILDCFCNGNFSSEGIFTNTWKLLGNEYLIVTDKGINRKTISKEEYTCEVPSYTTVQNAVDYLVAQIDNIVSDINLNFQSASLSITGGLDSRLVLSSLLYKNSVLKKMIYGESQTFHLPTRPEDAEVAKELSNITGIPLAIYNWTNPESKDGLDTKWQKELFSQVGFFNTVYCGNRSFTETITEVNNGPYMEFGYFLEAIRMREWLEKWDKNTFSVEDYFSINYAMFNTIPYSHKEEFLIWLKELFISKTKYLNIPDYDSIPVSLAAEIEWAFRERITDSSVHQFINYYMYAFPIFSVPQIHEFVIKLPTKITKKATFQVLLIKALNPDLLKTKVFSHRRYYRINKAGEKVLEWNLKNVLTVLGAHFPSLYKLLLPVYQKKSQHFSPSSNQQFFEELSLLLNNKFGFLDVSKYDGDVSLLFKLRQYLLAFNWSSPNKD